MMKSIALFALALLLTAGVFVTADKVEAGMTYADNKADCASACVDEVKSGCESDGMKMQEASNKESSGCCSGMDKSGGSI